MTCWEAVQEAFEHEMGILTTKEVVARIYARHPDRPWKENTISAHLIGMSVNHPSSHHHPHMQRHAMLFSLGNGRYRRWNLERDGMWVVTAEGAERVDVGQAAVTPQDEPDAETPDAGAAVSLERDLEQCLLADLEQRAHDPGNGSTVIIPGPTRRPQPMPNNPPTPNPVPAARALRARFQADWRRPRYHFVSPEGSCHPFDPNGALWWRGRCHLFYIVQVEGLGHCWGHASTVDLLHWRIHPLALVPGQGDEGIFSGCALLDKNGVPTIVYLGVRTGICLARSADDELIHWAKDPANPVIPIPEEGSPEAAQYIVHDPHAWLEGDRYYVLTNGRRSLGGREGDTAYLFRSPDLLHWEYLHPFYEPNPAWTGPEEDCACPDFFALGDRHVLLCISHYAGARAYVGRYANQRFLPERHVRMNWPGGTMFAPESLVDPRSGRRIFWGWVCPGRTRAAIDRAGWSGVMSLPRVLSLDEAGELRVEPAAEVERLRLDRVHAEGIDLMPGQDWPVEGLCDWAWEIELEVDADQLAAVDELALRVCCAPDGSEGTRIVYSPSAGTLSIDATRASLSPEVFWPWPHPHRLEGPMPEERVQRAPLALDPGEPLHLRVYLDGSILEVYANGRVCVTQRIYPTRSDSTGVALACAGGPLRVRRLRGWDMAATVAW